MTSTLRLAALPLILIALFLSAIEASAQPSFNIYLAIQNNGSGVDLGRDTLRWGVNPSATNNIDAALGEEEQPPSPPSGVFDVRFTNIGSSTNFGEGLEKNFHASTGAATQRDTFQIKVQAGDGGYPVRIGWPSNLSTYWGEAKLRYVDQDGTAQIVNMMTQSSVSFTSDGSPTNVRIFTLNPLAQGGGGGGVTVSPNPLAFGSVTLPPGTASRTLTIANGGSSSVRVDSVRSTSTDFLIGSTPSFPQTITASGTLSVTVNFSAATTGSYSGNIIVYHSGTGSPVTVPVSATVAGSAVGDGIYFNNPFRRVMDRRTGAYSEDIGLNYTGTVPVQGLQFKVTIDGAPIKITKIEPGPDLPNPGSFSFDYELVNAASGSEATVILYSSSASIPSGRFGKLFRMYYDVKNIRSCDDVFGGDSVQATARIHDVQSSLADPNSTSAGIVPDANLATTYFFIHNSSSRGDVNCDDKVDILDILETVDHILGREKFEPIAEAWKFNRVDLAPWSAAWLTESVFDDAINYGDRLLNVQDVVLISKAILAEEWPDKAPVSKTSERGEEGGGDDGGISPMSSSEASAVYDVKLYVEVAPNGINIRMNNLVDVKGIQMKIKAEEAPADLAGTLTPSLRGKFNFDYLVKNGEIRMLIYSLGGGVIPENEVAEDLLQLPFAITDLSAISMMTPIIIADTNNLPLLVEYQIDKAQMIGVGSDVATPSLGITAAPNPFTSRTSISCLLPASGNVTLTITDATGKEMIRMIDKKDMEAGRYQFELDGSNVASGTYFLNLSVDGSLISEKVELVK